MVLEKQLSSKSLQELLNQNGGDVTITKDACIEAISRDSKVFDSFYTKILNELEKQFLLRLTIFNK